MKWSEIKTLIMAAQRKANVMEVIISAILIMLGVVIVGTTYTSINRTALPNSGQGVTDAMNSATGAFSFLGLGLIVMGAMVVVGIIVRYARAGK